MALFVLLLCPFDISVGIGAFVIGPVRSPPFCLYQIADWIHLHVVIIETYESLVKGVV